MPRHRQGFPCCVHSPLPRVPPPLPRRNRSVLASLASRPLAAFPVFRAGRLPHHFVSRPAQRSTSLRPAWSLNRPGRPFVVGVLQPMSLPPSSAPTATGWSDSCRAGFAPAEEWRLVTAHRNPTLRSSTCSAGVEVAALRFRWRCSTCATRARLAAVCALALGVGRVDPRPTAPAADAPTDAPTDAPSRRL